MTLLSCGIPWSVFPQHVCLELVGRDALVVALRARLVLLQVLPVRVLLVLGGQVFDQVVLLGRLEVANHALVKARVTVTLQAVVNYYLVSKPFQ